MEGITYFALVFLIFISGFAAGTAITAKSGIANVQIIEQCEQNLPRNQHCKVIAVPEESK